MRDTSAQLMPLPDGRKLSFAEYGDRIGQPMIYCHGWPSSRFEALLADDAAAAVGVRLIAIDRPGTGWSDYLPGRRLVDWPDDVIEFANAVGIGRFSVLGISGGAPYAAVCAWKSPERVTAAGLVSGMGPIDAPGSTSGMSTLNRMLFRVVGRVPVLSRAAMEVTALMARNPDRLLGRAAVAEADQPKWEAARGVFRVAVPEAFRQGGRGQARELEIYARPWGFRPEDIRAPVHLWHGEADPNSPVSMGRHLAAAIPDCRATFYRGEGHLHFLDRLPEMLAAMCPRAGSTDHSR